MIKPNELRIGNLLMFGGSDNCWPMFPSADKVTAIEKDRFKLGNTVWSNEDHPHINPIELNDKWLKRCGLDHICTDPDKWHIPNSIYRLVPETTLAAGKWGFIVFNALAGYLTYVHQLQNIFHSLTGQELEINLNDI